MVDIISDPHVLTSTEMEALKLPSPMKLKLRWAFLALGIVGIIASILFYVFAWTADFFVLEMEYDHETFDLNLSILFGSVLLTGSLMIISQVWMNTSQYSENSFNLPHPKLRLRWGYLILGIVGIIVSILFFVFAWTDELAMTYNHEKFGLLNILFGTVILMGSLTIISLVWVNTSQNSENSFDNSNPKLSHTRESLKYHRKKAQKATEVDNIQFPHFATSRLIAAVLMLGMAAINMSTFGTLIDTENHIGEWFFLGGPSMFYPMSAFMFLVGLGLLLHTIFSTALIRFQKTEHFYTIEEYRLMLPWKTEIPIEEIEGIRITNAKTGVITLPSLQ